MLQALDVMNSPDHLMQRSCCIVSHFGCRHPHGGQRRPQESAGEVVVEAHDREVRVRKLAGAALQRGRGV